MWLHRSKVSRFGNSVATIDGFYKKRFSQNFACIVERFTNRCIILIGLFFMELLPFLLHQQICSWMSSFIINSNGSTLFKLAHYHMKIHILLQFDLTIFERVPGKICSRKNIQERIKSLNPLQIQINFVRDEYSRISWECQRYQGIIVMISWECQ
jgi:hypothetical protein